MKYFTLELLIRVNSSDRNEALHAHEEWENALERYQQHLKRIGPRLTGSVRKLAKAFSLHDATFLGLERPRFRHLHRSIAVLAARKDATVFLLVYMLTKEPRIHEFKGHWPFSKKSVHWLYDEFDVGEDGACSHEVLLSDGKCLTFEFKDVQLIRDYCDVNLDVA